MRESSQYNPREDDPLISEITQHLTPNPQLMQQAYVDATSHSLRSLFTASIITRRDLLEPLLFRLMRELVTECIKLSPIVPSHIYLPAPPIYCPQHQQQQGIRVCVVNTNHHDDQDDEAKTRIRLCLLVREMMIVFEATRLHVPLIKWYLEGLNEAANNMTRNLGVLMDS